MRYSASNHHYHGLARHVQLQRSKARANRQTMISTYFRCTHSQRTIGFAAVTINVAPCSNIMTFGFCGATKTIKIQVLQSHKDETSHPSLLNAVHSTPVIRISRFNIFLKLLLSKPLNQLSRETIFNMSTIFTNLYTATIAHLPSVEQVHLVPSTPTVDPVATPIGSFNPFNITIGAFLVLVSALALIKLSSINQEVHSEAELLLEADELQSILARDAARSQIHNEKLQQELEAAAIREADELQAVLRADARRHGAQMASVDGEADIVSGTVIVHRDRLTFRDVKGKFVKVPSSRKWLQRGFLPA